MSLYTITLDRTCLPHAVGDVRRTEGGCEAIQHCIHCNLNRVLLHHYSNCVNFITQ